MNKKKTIRIKSFAETNTYAYLHQTTYSLLRIYKSNETGRTYFGVSILVFSAFTMEAYCNHLGVRIIDNWKYLEKSSIIDKINIICGKLKIPVDYGLDPWNTVNQCIKFRNFIAHGKSSVSTDTIESNDEKYFQSSDDIPFPKSDWERILTDSLVLDVRKKIDLAIRTMHVASGLDGPLFSLGMKSRNSEFL